MIADGDWRSFLPKNEEWGLSMNNLELVAYATPSQVDAILDAIPEFAAESFWDEVLTLEVSRRLGTRDSLSFLGSSSCTYLLDDAWRANLARVAHAGLHGRSGLDEAAVSLHLRLAAWIEFPELAVGIPDVVVQALADGRRWVVEQALWCLGALAPSKAELLARFGHWLGADAAELRALGIRAVAAGWHGREYWRGESEIQTQAFALLVEALPGYAPEQVIDTLAPDAREHSRDPAVRLCRDLGLGDRLIERFANLLVRTHPRFAKTVSHLADALSPGHPLLDEIAQGFAEGVRGRSNKWRLLKTLVVVGDPRHADLFASLIDDEEWANTALEGLFRLSPALPATLCAALRERVAAAFTANAKGHPVFSALRQLSDALRREWVSDDALAERLLPDELTLRDLAWRFTPSFTRSARYRTALAAARPRLILEAQRELAQGRDDEALTALGRLRAEPGDGPEQLLVGVFEDSEAPASPRLLAAQALSEAPLAAANRERVLAVSKDARPLVRAWALRLGDDPQQWALAEGDESEAVRELALHRAR